MTIKSWGDKKKFSIYAKKQWEIKMQIVRCGA